MNGTDHQVPQPWLGRVRGRGQRHPGRLRFEITTLADYVASAPTDGLADLGRRAAQRGPGQPAHGRGVQPRRRPPGGAAGPSRPSSARPSRSAPCGCRPTGGPAPSSPEAWRAGDPQLRPRLDLRLLGRRRRRSPCSTATPRRPPSPRGCGPGPSRRRARRMATAGPGDHQPRGPGSRRRRRAARWPATSPCPGVQVLSPSPRRRPSRLAGTGADLGVLLGESGRRGIPDRRRRGRRRARRRGRRSGADHPHRPGARPPAAGTGPAMAEAWAQAGAHRDQPLTGPGSTGRLAAGRWPTSADVAGFGWQAWEPAPLAVDPGDGRAGASLANGLVQRRRSITATEPFP